MVEKLQFSTRMTNEFFVMLVCSRLDHHGSGESSALSMKVARRIDAAPRFSKHLWLKMHHQTDRNKIIDFFNNGRLLCSSAAINCHRRRTVPRRYSARIRSTQGGCKH
jgi:hypothetical protein